MTTLLALWPAIAVWLLMVLPQMAWNADRLRDSEWLELGRGWRAFLWLVTHTWPYSKLYKYQREWQRVFPEPPPKPRCPLCGSPTTDALVLYHLLEWHFPGEQDAWEQAEDAVADRYWTPPTDPAEAVRWLEERTGATTTGSNPSASAAISSTAASRSQQA